MRRRGEADSQLDRGSSWYVLALLTFSYALAYIDRQLLNLLVDPVKRSLLLTDTELSLVQGLAFISAYIAAAPVFGRLADVTNRRNLLVFSVCAWSLATVMCGYADTYHELLAARFAVGVSEACVLPIGWSMIPDFFSERRVPRATSLFMMGGQIGGAISLLAGGTVIAFSGSLRERAPALASLETWQLSFVVIGLSGALLVLLLLTFREPVRRKTMHGETTGRMTMREGWSYLWARRAFYGRIYLGIGSIGIVFLGIPVWFPSYLIRVHDLAPVEVGLQFGGLTLFFGMAGTFLGPTVARVIENRGYQDGALRTAAASAILMFAFCFAIPFATSKTVALTIAAGVIFFCSFPTGMIAFATQLATPGRMRGMAASFYTIFAQVIGYGIGPTLVATLTDRVFKDPDAVGLSLQIVTCCAAIFASIMIFTVLSPYRRLLDANAGEVILAPSLVQPLRERPAI